MIRFIYIFNYAKGVSFTDSEAWYLEEHVAQAKKLLSVQRYLSWRGLEVPSELGIRTRSPSDQYVRRSELWFEDFGAWQQAFRANPALWTPSKEGVPGFREFECMFLDVEPQYDLLQDVPGQQYRYITLPLIWPKGPPPWVEDTGDLVVNNYFFYYRSDISIADGEDWYLGHHTREGKQTPGVKHYKTWKTIHVLEEPDSFLRPNKWFRLTERGFVSFAAWAALMNKETGIRFTPSPLGEVCAEWGCIVTRPALVDDLLAQ